MTNHNRSTIHLQSVGKVPAIPAKDLQIGDRTIWNFGHIEVVEGVVLRGQSAYVTLKSLTTGKSYTRTFRQNRLVGIATAKPKTIPTSDQLLVMSGADRVALMQSLPKDQQAIVAERYAESNSLFLDPSDYDYHWQSDHNVYPHDTVIYEPEAIKRVLLADRTGIIGLVDVDVIPSRYEQQKAQADQVIANYAKIGRDALWAYSEAGGFWLMATDTLPAKYVSMQQAQKETAIPAEPHQLSLL